MPTIVETTKLLTPSGWKWATKVARDKDRVMQWSDGELSFATADIATTPRPDLVRISCLSVDAVVPVDTVLAARDTQTGTYVGVTPKAIQDSAASTHASVTQGVIHGCMASRHIALIHGGRYDSGGPDMGIALSTLLAKIHLHANVVTSERIVFAAPEAGIARTVINALDALGIQYSPLWGDRGIVVERLHADWLFRTLPSAEPGECDTSWLLALAPRDLQAFVEAVFKPCTDKKYKRYRRFSRWSPEWIATAISLTGGKPSVYPKSIDRGIHSDTLLSEITVGRYHAPQDQVAVRVDVPSGHILTMRNGRITVI